MTVPVFVGAGAGAAVTTGTLTISKTGCTAGNILIGHVVTRGTAQDWSGTNHVNILKLDGTSGFNPIQEHAVGNPYTSTHFVASGRVAANGTCSSDVVVGASGDDLFGRLYEFSGCSLGTTEATVFENAAAVLSALANTSTSVGDEPCITNGPDRLALAFIGIASNQATADFTGESGGDWTEAIAEYSSAVGATATLQLQTASMPSAGTIDGGAYTITSSQWGCITMAIIPAPSSPVLTPIKAFEPNRIGPF